MVAGKVDGVPRTAASAVAAAIVLLGCGGGATSTSGSADPSAGAAPTATCALPEPVPERTAEGCLGDSWSPEEGCPPSPQQHAACVRQCNAMLQGGEHLDCEGDCGAQRELPLDWFRPTPWRIAALLARPPASGDYQVEGYVARVETCGQTEGRRTASCRPHVVLTQTAPTDQASDGRVPLLPLTEGTFIRVGDPRPECYQLGQQVRWFITVVAGGDYGRMQWSPNRRWHR